MAAPTAVVPDIVVLGLAVASREDLFRDLSVRFRDAGIARDAAALAAALIEREGTRTTAVGGGVALPHARTPAAAREGVAVVRLKPPLEFEAPDGAPVDVVFVLVGPPGDPAEHLRRLAAVARGLQDRDLLRGLRENGDIPIFTTPLSPR